MLAYSYLSSDFSLVTDLCLSVLEMGNSALIIKYDMGGQV